MTGDKPDLTAARALIAPYIRLTPILDMQDAGLGDVVLKLDQLQPSGSFKIRGAAHAILSQATPPKRVAAASGGNHGAGVAYMARRLNMRADIFVPETAPKAKIDRLHLYGATVHIKGQVFADAFAAAQDFATEHDALFIHAYDDMHVITGQATCVHEFQDQAAFDTLLVAVGGGGLASGCALALKPHQKMICIETEGTATLYRALAAGHPTPVQVTGLAADALGAKRIGDLNFGILKQVGAHSLLVSDNDVRTAQRFLWDHARLIAEPGGATALAALTSGAYVSAPGERVGVIICGANCDPGSIFQ